MTIGHIFHLIHVTGDLAELEAWYDDVFGVRRGFLDNHYLEDEKRDASLVVLGDVVIEPLAPAFREEGWEDYPLGRFYRRFGNHWHSIAWYCEDDIALWHQLQSNGIRILGEAADQPPSEDPVPIFTHPNDTVTQLEFLPTRMAITGLDPRFKPDFDPQWWRTNHPLGLHGMAYTTVLTRDLRRATHTYTTVLGGTVVGQSSSALTGTDDVYIRIGHSLVQLSIPNRGGTLAADDLAAHGEMHHAVCFRVDDLDRAEDYLRSKEIKTVARDDHTILTDPDTTHGAPFRFTCPAPGAA
ncbi:VOC family protein [Gordonia rhizosphera]|uniref:VOC domain-containing protein n=1 Tax=Gordonia rhizosphera NBRC 16068 TaxID=1108045 RepID=K6WC23_9ACTN|nr:VOC family protein [Gordonia rhizosphera]GAB89747.1 hypothetical protein GORHZ_070_00010 [Gordonia rhizosphera NBRC 16068]